MTVYFPLSQGESFILLPELVMTSLIFIVFYNALLASLNLRENLRGNARVYTAGRASDETEMAEPRIPNRPGSRPLRIPNLAGILSSTGAVTILPPYTVRQSVTLPWSCFLTCSRPAEHGCHRGRTWRYIHFDS